MGVSLVSVIVVSWNSGKYLYTCLKKLSAQTCESFEVIIVDNGSSDGDTHGIEEKFPELNIHTKTLSKNTGFAVANNIGAQMAQGKWLVLLNADAFPEPDWLENLVRAAEQFPNASFSSRQIQANRPERLDGEGDIYRLTGFAKRRSYNIPVYPPHEELVKIFSPCAAAALYPRQAFGDVEGFDEDYFSYYEDVDLGFRLRLYGLESYYVPSAIVHHVGSASTGKMSDFSVYYAHRNLIWTYLKNMPSLFLWFTLPLHILISFAFLLTRHRKVIWQAKKDALLAFPSVLEKRKEIQKNRKASLKEIWRAFDKRIFVRY